MEYEDDPARRRLSHEIGEEGLTIVRGEVDATRTLASRKRWSRRLEDDTILGVPEPGAQEDQPRHGEHHHGQQHYDDRSDQPAISTNELEVLPDLLDGGASRGSPGRSIGAIYVDAHPDRDIPASERPARQPLR